MSRTRKKFDAVAMMRSIRNKISAEIEDACGTALREPLPDPNEEDWCAISTRRLAEGKPL